MLRVIFVIATVVASVQFTNGQKYISAINFGGNYSHNFFTPHARGIHFHAYHNFLKGYSNWGIGILNTLQYANLNEPFEPFAEPHPFAVYRSDNIDWNSMLTIGYQKFNGGRKFTFNPSIFAGFSYSYTEAEFDHPIFEIHETLEEKSWGINYGFLIQNTYKLNDVLSLDLPIYLPINTLAGGIISNMQPKPYIGLGLMFRPQKKHKELEDSEIFKD